MTQASSTKKWMAVRVAAIFLMVLAFVVATPSVAYAEEPSDGSVVAGDAVVSDADDCVPAAFLATGEGIEQVSACLVDDAYYLLLPSYATGNVIQLGWSDDESHSLFASPYSDGPYIEGSIDLDECAVDDQGYALVYMRASSTGDALEVKVGRATGVRTLFLKSDDPTNSGRDYIEASADHTASATGCMTLVEDDGTIVAQDAELTSIKGRGNSTWHADKKPYQIKLAKKASLLDGGSENKAKTWVLLANAYDDSHLRNYVALKTAEAEGLVATPAAEYVELYYDGEYRGLYLLCEKVQVADGRVEINEIENESPTGDDLDDLPIRQGANAYGQAFTYVKGAVAVEGADDTGGYLVELDNGSYASERCHFETTVGYFTVKSPENATYNQMKYISEFVQEAIDESSSTDGDLTACFDADSLARYFLVNELAKNTDYLRYSSTYFYKDCDPDVLHAGPVWDFDLAFGVHDYEGYAEYIDTSGITDVHATFFLKNEQFRTALKQVVEDGAVAVIRGWIDGNASSSVPTLNEVRNCLSSALARDELVWGYYDPDNLVAIKFKTYAESGDYFEEWLEGRIAWMEDALVEAVEEYAARPQVDPTVPAKLTRYAGDTALDTMSNIVDAGKFETGGTAILVTSAGYWDALTASGLAGMVDAPIIMTAPTALSPQVKSQLAKLRPKTIVVCGGTSALPESVAKAAASAAGGAKLERCWGENAVGTAIDIYNRASEITGESWSSVAFICTSDGYWDALSAAPISYSEHVPIFLTDTVDTISNETIEALVNKGIKAVYIIGGPLAVGPAVEQALQNAGITVVDRFGGATSIETSEEVASYGIARGMSADGLGIATTNGYWDALCGSAFCGKNNAVLVLVDVPTSDSITHFISEKKTTIANAYVFGGLAAISEDTYNAVESALSLQASDEAVEDDTGTYLQAAR